MMVMLWKSVECSAKIAMTTLRRGHGAMRLLPIHDLPRLIFLDARDVTNLLVLEWAMWHQGDYKSIICSADAIHRNIFPSLRTAT
jgi:hypothetical protein